MLSRVDISSGINTAADSSSAATSTVCNWEIDTSGAMLPRFGTLTHPLSGLTTDPVIGLCQVGAEILIVTQSAGTGVRRFWRVSVGAPNTAVSLDDGTTSSRLEGTARPTFAIGSQAVYIAGGGRVSRWAAGAPYVTMLTASPNCTHVAAIGQRLVVNAGGELYQWSDIGEATWDVWPAENASAADARPDPLVGVYENTRELYLFGTETTQVHQVGADPTLPYDYVSSMNIGLGAPYLVTKWDDSLVLLDDRRRLVRSDGRSFEVLSDDIENTLRGFSSLSDAWAHREDIGSYSRLVFCFPSHGVTFVFDPDTKKWTTRTYYSGGVQQNWPAAAHCYWTGMSRHMYASTLSGGGLFSMSRTAETDMGAPILCERVTGWHDHGTSNRKRSSRLVLTIRRGTEGWSDQAGYVEIRVQNDDGGWSGWRQVRVGPASTFSQTVYLHFGGVFRRRRYHIRFGAPFDVSVTDLEDDITDLEATG